MIWTFAFRLNAAVRFFGFATLPTSVRSAGKVRKSDQPNAAMRTAVRSEARAEADDARRDGRERAADDDRAVAPDPRDDPSVHEGGDRARRDPASEHDPRERHRRAELVVEEARPVGERDAPGDAAEERGQYQVPLIAERLAPGDRLLVLFRRFPRRRPSRAT